MDVSRGPVGTVRRAERRSGTFAGALSFPESVRFASVDRCKTNNFRVRVELIDFAGKRAETQIRVFFSESISPLRADAVCWDPENRPLTCPLFCLPPALHFRKTAVCHHDRRRQLWLYSCCCFVPCPVHARWLLRRSVCHCHGCSRYTRWVDRLERQST
ncbi:MAG TPA: hypothetical protein DC058_12665 [Planctomycetaceae bacterium]|nr:hypothetical protein [Planctomycetaceae bacterium]